MDSSPETAAGDASPERFDPSFSHHIWYEHWHRYHWAARLAEDRVVVDIACGEGYGSDLMAETARLAIGIDADAGAVEGARKTYARDRLHFLQGDARQLPLADDSIDLLVSFETLEHLAEHERMVSEIARVTAPEGLAVISTPDRDIYSPDGVRHNEHHVRELNAAEFRQLLSERFEHVRVFGQQFQLMSVIDEIDREGDPSATAAYADASGHRVDGAPSRRPVYLIAVCGHDAEAVRSVPLPDWHAFNDVDGALFAHYEEQIRRLQEVDVALERAQRELRESRAAAAHLAARLGY